MGYMCVCLHLCVCAWMNTTTYIWAIKQPHTYIYIYIDTHIVSESYQEGNVQLYQRAKLSVITIEINLSGEMCHNK